MTIQAIKYVYWQEEDAWLGHLQDDPTTGLRGDAGRLD
ncbi:hypothetical protein FTUN_4237 [Frigoriglobus tundricola]|uniref:Type II toxin-antitoxin system HicB family antitoxin n=1 Tax=Frigoriglobus tundricola TaxID=2774151 RepID=A0A6M5YTH0_9BACT|nr:hypothetical protein FTUN_4237 [Frigoriglobus tundricola]